MLLRKNPLLSVIVAALLAGGPALAQGVDVSFGGLKADTSLPVEVTADQLKVDQRNGNAVFTGNVLVVQGEMRLSAASIRVEYTEDGKKIDKIYADGDVLLVSATDAAKADAAVYTIATGGVVLTGNVLLTQGETAIASERMVIDLKSGTGQLDGRVTTTFIPKEN